MGRIDNHHGQDIGDQFDSMALSHPANDMFKQMDQMHNRMMENFGKPMMDPFKNDPFFQDSGFGRSDQMFQQADNMMNQMRAEMKRGMGDMNAGQLGKGQFIKQTYHRKGDEVYQTKAHGALGGGNRMVERQQMYENKGQGLQKAAHERLLNNQGRKVVKQNYQGNVRSEDIYKGMQASQGNEFDRQWSEMADNIGFVSGFGNGMLEYGGNGSSFKSSSNARSPPRRQGNPHFAEARGLGAPSSNNAQRAEARGLGYVDDSRRGHYIPQDVRGQDRPVRQNNGIGPTQPTGRVEPIGPAWGGGGNTRSSNNNGQSQPQRAIPAGPSTTLGGAPTRVGGGNGAARAPPPRINNYQQPAARRAPARAG